MQIKYGGFWRRFAAGAVDMFIVSMVDLVVSAVWALRKFPLESADELNFPLTGDWLASSGWLVLFYIFFPWLYYALFYCSKHQGTPGMLLFRMRLYTYAGERVSFGKATGRFFAASIISGSLTLGIGYLMIAFTKRKQALHDFIAHTLVVVSPTPTITIENALARQDR